MALSESLKKSGKDYIAAVAMGNEVVCRMGTAYLGDMYYQGFHPTSTCGMMAASVTAANRRPDGRRSNGSRGRP